MPATYSQNNKEQTDRNHPARVSNTGGSASLPAIPALQKKEEDSNLTQNLTEQKSIAQFAGEGNPAPASSLASPVAKSNNTGIPDQLKSGVENLSGMDLSDVQVHYNSSHPAQLNAYAYAKGSDIHLGPGQEQHLPHEAWHVVQQKQGRVQASHQMKQGPKLNDDPGLEHEADIMGSKAAQMKSYLIPSNTSGRNRAVGGLGDIVQRAQVVNTNVKMETEAQGDTHWKMVDEDLKGRGDEVHDSIGVNGIYAGPFANIQGGGAVSMWRAHGVARRFGGAGVGDNVGWWPEAVEALWTQEEWKVAGVADEVQTLSTPWAVGRGETGSYRVDRVLTNGATVLARYKDPIIAAINWAYDDARNAWTRAIVTYGTLANGVDQASNRADLATEKARAKQADLDAVNLWFETYFKPATDLVISNMKLKYTETVAGTNQNPLTTHDRQRNTKIVSGKAFNGRPRDASDTKRDVAYTGTNAVIANLRINGSTQVIWDALVAGNALVAHNGIPALALGLINRLDLFQNAGPNVRFRPVRCADGFGAPLP